MATLSPQNRGYSSGSLAAQPTRHAGGVRGRNEDPAQFRARMDGGAMAHGQMPRGVTPPPMAAPTRQDNIIASRVDGTFNTKRNAFNAANAGKLTMDEAGNINPAATPATPAAPPTPSPTPTPTASPVPPVNQVTPPTPKLPAGGSSPMMKPIGKIDGRPASLVLGEMKQQPGAAPSPAVAGVRPPVTRTAGGELVQPGNAMNPNARYGKPAAAPAAAPMVAQAPAPAMPAAAPAPASPVMAPAPVSPTPMSGPGAPTLEGRAQALQDAARLSQATQGPMPRAVAPSPTPSPAAPPVARPAPVAAMAPTAPPASPAVAAPAPRAVAPPLSKPKTLAELKAAADAAKAARQPGLTKIGNTVASGVSQLTQGGSQLAQTINTGVPQLATSVAGSIETAGKTALSSLDNTLAPARNWLSGSEQKSPEELAYEEALAAEQKKKKSPGVPAVTPRPGSSAPQPFSAAALGTTKPRAVMPPSLVALNR